MEGVLTSDIFFFVTTIAIGLISIAALIVLIYFILILRDIRNISHRIQEETDSIAADFSELREAIKSKKVFLAPIFYFVTKAFKRHMRKKKCDHDEDEVCEYCEEEI